MFSLFSDAQIRVFDEVDSVRLNFMYSYYEQDGLHSPVTGGIGDEYLYDHGRKISVIIPLENNTSLSLLSGIDIYTSASTDNINDEHDLLLTETSASYKDERRYSNIGLEIGNKKGYIIGANTGFSEEWDVSSISAGISIARLSKDENTQMKLSTSYYKDVWDLIYPYELRPLIITDLEDVKRSLNISLMMTKIINKRLKMGLSIETVSQKGLLSTPFHRVYFSDTTHYIEQLPNKRFKVPIAMYSSYYMNDFSILRFYYRFYTDDFDIKAHTIQIESPIKVAPFIVVSPFYRLHTQNESKYFEPFAVHDVDDDYYTSDYDLSSFSSHKLGFGVKYSPLFGFSNKMKIESAESRIKFQKIEIRTAKYFRINQSGLILKSYIVTLGLSYLIN